MRGVITDWDVVSNLGLIRREFGAASMLRCVVAVVTRRDTTFLDVVTPRSEQPPGRAPARDGAAADAR